MATITPMRTVGANRGSSVNQTADRDTSGQSPHQQAPAGQDKRQSAAPSAVPVLLTPAQAAKQLGVSERTFHSLRRQPWFPHPVVLGPRITRFVAHELAAACASAPRGTPTEPSQFALARRAKIEAMKAGVSAGG